MAKKSSARKSGKTAKRRAKEFTADDILDLWRKESKKGLKSKKFAKEVFDEFEPRLKKAIITKLATPDAKGNPTKFTPKDEKQTRELAFALGSICNMITVENEIAKDTFQRVFKLIKSSDKCPGGGGGGEWCNI